MKNYISYIQLSNTAKFLLSLGLFFSIGFPKNETILFDKLFYEKTKDSWRDELNYWPKQKGVQHDQTIWNVLTDKYYGKYNILDDDWGSWRKRGKFITHYSGPTETSEWTEEKFLKWERKI